MQAFLFFASLLIYASCNPELKNIGASDTDLVKYFKVTRSSENALGEGTLIIAHIGEKRLLTFFLKNPNGTYSHTDVMIRPGGPGLFEVDNVSSQTPQCQLQPDISQPRYFDELIINSVSRPYHLEILTKEEAMSGSRQIGC